MNTPAFIIRNYRPQDFNKVVKLWAEAEKEKQVYNLTSLQELIESLGRPHHFPENNLFLAEVMGDIIGYVDVMPELGIGRVVLSCLIHPDYRKEVYIKRLIEHGFIRAKELGVKRVHVVIPQESMAAKRLFSIMGFRFVRRFLELTLDLYESQLPDIGQNDILFRYLRCGEEEKLMHLQNRSFVNTWGYNPNTLDEIIYRTSLQSCSPEDVILACEADSLIGYCWTRRIFGENEIKSRDKGRIYMLGVDPQYQWRGIGKQVLLTGLSHLKSKGVKSVELSVDSENKAACSLYRSAGFEILARSLWYEKVLS
jgi:mycothiol synthase